MVDEQGEPGGVVTAAVAADDGCDACGRPVPRAARWCGSCGAPVTEWRAADDDVVQAPAVVGSTSPPSARTATADPTDEHRGRARRAVVVTGLLGAVVAGTFGLQAVEDRAAAPGGDGRVELPVPPPETSEATPGGSRGPAPLEGCPERLDWCTTLDQRVSSVAAGPEGTIVVALSQRVALLDADTGDVRWEQATKRPLGGQVVVAPGPDGGLDGAVVVTQGAFLGAQAFAAIDGTALWDEPRQQATAVVGRSIISVERVDGQRIATARDASTRALQWEQPASSGRSRLLAADERSTVIGDSTVVEVLDTGTGERTWQRDQPAAGISVPAALSDELLLVLDGPFGRLHALDRATGERRWQVPVDGLPSGIATRGTEVFLATGDGGRVLEASAGEVLAMLEIEGFGRPSVATDANGVVTWATEAATVVDPPDGPARDIGQRPGERLVVVDDQLLSLAGRTIRADTLAQRLELGPPLTPPLLGRR